MSESLKYELVGDLPLCVRALTYNDFHGWIVGSGAHYLVGKKNGKPKDWDVLAPPHEWVDACRIFPKGTPTNTYGGLKHQEGDICLDVWAEDLGHYFLTALPRDGIILAVQPRFRKVAKLYLP